MYLQGISALSVMHELQSCRVCRHGRIAAADTAGLQLVRVKKPGVMLA
jgi:hypothetical protein